MSFFLRIIVYIRIFPGCQLLKKQLAISYYKTIATLNESHKIYLVQHQETLKIYVKKVLDVYNKDIYKYLFINRIPGIPHIIDLFETDNQLIVFEHYISGHSLQELMDSGVLNIHQIYDYMLALCSIVESLHTSTPPIIHRDIKPSNIMITDENRVILLDFNAAKPFNATSETDTVLLGTKGYAAPEQYGFGSSSPRTDIYAMGILLKELTSSLPSVPQALTMIVKKCTEINPADRYSSIAELKNELLKIKYPNETLTKSIPQKTAIPPGFRTKTPWKMLVAIMGYAFIFWLCLSLQVKDTFGLALWVERIFCLLIMLSMVFGFANYLDIQKYFPLCKNRNKILHFIGVLFMNFLLTTSLLLTMFIIQSIFF